MRHPVDEFEVRDEALVSVIGGGARLVKVADTDAHEGPVYVPDEDALYFTTVPRLAAGADHGSPEVAVKRIQLDGEHFPVGRERETVVSSRANGANGMTLARDGNLIVCEQGTATTAARIASLDPATGGTETVVTGCDGSSFNSPNDVVVRSDGTVWFTDPSYGQLQGFKPGPARGDYGYRYDPQTRRTTVVAEDFDKPNGPAFSPDESLLYIGDSGANHEPGTFEPARPHHIREFDVTTAGTLVNGRLFAVIDPGFPDGIKVDIEGRVYSSAFDGVHVLAPEGFLLGKIHLPGAVNFTFGGRDRNILFITADTAVWAAVLNTQGA
jgi:gluconolactonase